MVLVVSERGFAGTTVSAVCARAAAGRTTFYEAFSDLQHCFLAVLDEGHRRASKLVSQGFAAEEHWQDGVRAALANLLSFFDSEPVWARVLFVEVLAAGSWALEHRERSIQRLRSMIVEYWAASGEERSHPLASDGVMVAVLGIITSHLVQRRPAALITLLGPLMGVVGAAYLPPKEVTKEIERGDELAKAAIAAYRHQQLFKATPQDQQQDIQIPAVLLDTRAHRARECIRYVAEHPGASNRQVGAAVGITRDSHISTLLARLRKIGLLDTHPPHPGGPNAWAVTPYGNHVAQAMRSRTVTVAQGTHDQRHTDPRTHASPTRTPGDRYLKS